MYDVKIFRTKQGKKPFREWLQTLSAVSRSRIFKRLLRMEKGNLGDYKRVGAGVFELRLFFDGGLRIYFGRDGDEIILLLCGGDKSTQKRDIDKAQEYWRQYHEQEDEISDS